MIHEIFLLSVLASLASVSAMADTAQDVEALARQCNQAYRHEDLAFVYQHCPYEAWALARAQCERGDESVAERYKVFCKAFKAGRAPAY